LLEHYRQPPFNLTALPFTSRGGGVAFVTWGAANTCYLVLRPTSLRAAPRFAKPPESETTLKPLVSAVIFH